jgi:hypothetical protein
LNSNEANEEDNEEEVEIKPVPSRQQALESHDILRYYHRSQEKNTQVFMTLSMRSQEKTFYTLHYFSWLLILEISTNGNRKPRSLGGFHYVNFTVVIFKSIY